MSNTQSHGDSSSGTLAESRTRPNYSLRNVDYPDEAEARAWLRSGAWLSETIGSVLRQTARHRASATAVVDEGGRLTYPELDARSIGVAQQLRALGLQPGERVLVQVGIGRSAVVTLMGLFRAGVIPVCTVPQYRLFELSALAEQSEARAHLVEVGAGGSSDLVALARDVRAASPNVRDVIVVGADPDAESDTVPLDTSHGLDDTGPTLEDLQPSPLDVGAFQLSGGTTGVPKIIPRFHAEYVGYANAWCNRLALSGEDVILWSLPITHNAGMLCFLIPAILSGATLVLHSRFEIEEFLGTIERERVTVTGSIGPIAARLLDYEHPESFDLSSVRLFVTLNRAAQIEEHLGVPAQCIYGITEGLLLASRPGSTARPRHETVGFPASPVDEVRILEPGLETEVTDGAIGELCFRGPSVLRGYYGDRAATEAAFTTDGFFRTGDLVRAHDVEGTRYFSFEGRIKDNIDRGGEKFGVEPIEVFLASHPSILQAAVVGMPDPYLGERVCAFVIPRAGAASPRVEDVGEFLLERGLAKFKLPERIELVDGFPVTSVGKLDRVALRQQIANVLEQEARHRLNASSH
jgi:non-ribosomal peptide synthetase component E (peptide arylation enzyme)